MRFIFIPATKHPFLRRWLAQHGFALLDETPVLAAGRYYTVMHAAYTGGTETPDPLWCVVGRAGRGPHAAGYLAREAMLLKKEARGAAPEESKRLLALAARGGGGCEYMPSLTELASYLESIAPAQIAESWDNVGVLVRCAQEVTGVLCALDITPATVREARAVGCNAIVSHHPVIFRPLKELRQGDVPALLVREGVSAVCMHTNLDKAQGGVNDVLAQALGLRDTEPFAGGIGRVGALPETMEAAAFAQFVGKALAAP